MKQMNGVENNMSSTNFNDKFKHYDFPSIRNSIYESAMKKLISLATDEKTKSIVNKLLYEGEYGNFSVNSNLTTPNNALHEGDRRINYASMAICAPDTFEKISKDNIILFHGTNSTILPDILKNGLQSESEIINNGKEITTGEYSFNKPRDFISFTDKPDLALSYSLQKPNSSSSAKSSFSVIIGMSVNEFDKNNPDIRRWSVHSDTPEVGILKCLPSKYIKMLAVPQSKIDEVQQLTLKYNLDSIQIVPAEDFVNSVSLSNDCVGSHYVIDSSELIMEGTSSFSKFKKEDVKELATSPDRKLGNIQQLFSKLKNLFLTKVKGNNKDEQSRN